MTGALTNSELNLWRLILPFALGAMAVTVAATSAFSDDCTTVDLNTEAPLKDMPVLDQGKSGTCYAFATAGALEYEYRKSGLPGCNRSVSAIDLGFLTRTYENEGNRGLGGGYQNDAVAAALTQGVATKECVDHAISAYETDILKDKNSQEGKFFSQVIKAGFVKTASGTLWDLDKSGGKLTSESLVAAMDFLYESRNAPPGQCTKPAETVDNFWFHSTLDSLKPIIYPCEAERAASLKCATHSFGPKEDKASARQKQPPLVASGIINSALDKKNPAIISFCAKGLFSTGLGGGDSCGSHAALVVGRAMHNGKCEYLIRNSSGARANSMGLHCACKVRNKYYSDCNDVEVQIAALKGKQKDALEDDYAGRVEVGCWVDGAELKTKVLHAGAFGI